MLSNTQHNPLKQGFSEAACFRGIYANAIDIPTDVRQLRISGVTGVAPTGSITTAFECQFQQLIQNIETELAAANMTLKDLVQIRFYLTQRKHVEKLRAMQTRYFEGMTAAITTRLVTDLSTERSHIEADAQAYEIQPLDSIFARIL